MKHGFRHFFVILQMKDKKSATCVTSRPEYTLFLSWGDSPDTKHIIGEPSE